jgi:alkylation response protein AidB-like acyl-CoA dehydrogenase
MSAVTVTASPSAEREEILALAAELARRELSPRALELDRRRPEALEEAWRHVSEVGFDRALLAPEDGGVGLDVGSLLVAVEELAVGEAGIALLVLLANAALVALPAERAAGIGTEGRWALVPVPAPAICTPARVAASAGPDGHPVLSGTLAPALGALGAAGVVVVGSGVQPLVAAVASDAPGVAFAPSGSQLGLRSAAAARIDFEAVSAQAAAGPAEAHEAAEASLCLLRAGSAAIARGVARRAQGLAFAYAQERVQGGVAIVEHDAVREMLAAMVLRAATTAASPGGALEAGSALIDKVAATEAALASCVDAVQVFGGSGYMHETGVEKLMRDAKYLQLWPEPNWTAADGILEQALRGR